MTSPGGNIVEIRVVARDLTAQGFDSAIKRAKGLAAAVSGGPGSASAALVDAEKKASGLGATLRRVGEVAGGVLVADMVQQAAARAVQLVKSTAKAASDLGESINAVGKTFESASSQVIQWGEDNASAFGLSQRAFNAMAVPLGAMLKNQGLQLDQVTEHTIKLTERAADMASVFNTDVTDALVAIQAGLRGEIDPLERYGVSLSAVAVEQKALAETGKTSAKELTAQEKALARLNLIYEQTADTAGDFADTSTGMANAQRIATAQIEDAQAKIGTAFTPVLAKAAMVSGELADSFTSMPGPVQLAAAAVVGLGAAIGLLAPKAMAAKAALDGMAASDSAVQRGMAKTTVVVGKAAAAFAALQVAGAVASAFFHDDLNPQIDAATQGVEDWNRQAKLGGEAARLFGEDMESLGFALEQVAGSGFSQFNLRVDEFLGLGSELEDMRGQVAAFDAVLAALVQSGNGEQAMRLLEKAAAAANMSIEDLKSSLPTYSGAVEVAAKGTKQLADKAGTAAGRVEELNNEVTKFIDETLGLEASQDAAADAMARLAEQVARQKKEHEAGAGALTGNTQAARDNRESVRDLTAMYQGLINKGLATAQQFQDQLEAMGFARAEAQRYTAELFKLNAAIAAIPSQKTVTVTVKTSGAKYRIEGASAEQLAHGGIVGAATGGIHGGRRLVGEQGPEIVDLPYGSIVHPAGTTEAMLSQSHPAGGMTQRIELGSDGSRMGDLLIWLIANAVRGKGGDPGLLGIKI